MKTRKNKNTVGGTFLNCTNPDLLRKFHAYNAKHVEVMYHMTSKENAINIMKHGFDPSKSLQKAFGAGVNFSTEVEEVYRYASKTNNYIIVSLVKYNKKKLNSSNIDEMVIEGDFGYSKPKYMHPPKGYNALYAHDIYVIPTSEQIYPMYAYKV